MTPYVYDGFEFDLDCCYVDVVGVEWRWSGERNAAGEPLMVGGACKTSAPLPDVYRDHGPLIPIGPPSLTGAMVRDAFTGTVIP